MPLAVRLFGRVMPVIPHLSRERSRQLALLAAAHWRDAQGLEPSPPMKAAAQLESAQDEE